MYRIIVRKPAKVGRFGADPNVKLFWRTVRSWICHNHKLYYSYVLLVACGVYNFWWNTCVGYYRRRNYHRSLDFAIQKEKEWELIKPKDDDDYGEEDYGEEAPAEGGDAEGGAAEGGGGDGDAEDEDE